MVLGHDGVCMARKRSRSFSTEDRELTVIWKRQPQTLDVANHVTTVNSVPWGCCMLSGGGDSYLDLRKGRLKSQSIVRRTMESADRVSTCGPAGARQTAKAKA